MKLLPLVVVGLLLMATVGVGAVVPPTDGAESYRVDRTTGPSQLQLGSDETDDTAEPEITNVLAIPGIQVERSDLRHHHVDLGPAADFETAALAERLATETIERDLGSLDSAADREARIEAEYAAIEANITTLERRELTAIREFSDGEVAPRELLIELATIHQTAAALRERKAMLEQEADEIDSEVVSTDRQTDIEYDLRMLQGPIRAHAIDILRGDRPANRISIETGENSVALTAIDGDQYLREVQRTGLRGEGDGEITPEVAEEITQKQYPILWDQSTSWSSGGPGSVMMTLVQFDGGELRTFIDGASEETFIEHQRLPLSMVMPADQTTKVQDGLSVTVDRTYIGGPLQVTVIDADTGEPVDATVTIGQNGQESQIVGETTAEGSLWTLTPRDQFTITVFGEGTSAAFVVISPQDASVVTQ